MGKDGLQVMQKTDHCSSDLCPFASPTSALPLLLPPYSSHISSIFVLEEPACLSPTDDPPLTEVAFATLPSRPTAPSPWTSSCEDGTFHYSGDENACTVDNAHFRLMGEHLIPRTTDQHRRTMATDTHKLIHQHHQAPRRDDREGHASLTNVSRSAKPVLESTPRCLDLHDWQLASANTSGQFPPLSPSPAPSGDCRPEGRLKDRDKTELPGIYAYCFDRGNGNYTRLIPADMLPPVLGIPAIQQGSGGMMVLPFPGAEPVRGPSSNVQPVTLKETIDTIVACSPAGPKRTKVYCDKWVHEGVWAFTQQGCRYKHEMPLDKATQHSLGLFHGLPTWWRKQQAELQRRQLTISGRNVDDSVQVTSAPGGAVFGGEQQGRGAVAEVDQSR
ncbi:hypothetical protein BN1723_004975, partial [Verticillium longisporum]